MIGIKRFTLDIILCKIPITNNDNRDFSYFLFLDILHLSDEITQLPLLLEPLQLLSLQLEFPLLLEQLQFRPLQ